jgi:LacI family transcriptional regulator/LacI family repressor for deo operon, udp, cdd, tsx, nupC, and nupG
MAKRDQPEPRKPAARRRPTIADVADAAGVSKATVSAVLNEKGTVSKATRQRVLEVMERLNYRPSSRARRMGARRTKSIGLLVKEANNPFYADIAISARQRASAHGYTLLVASSEGEGEAERSIFELLRDKDVDGILVNPVFGRESDLAPLFELKHRNFPLVLLEEIRGLQASLVHCDGVQSTKKATEHLLELGHTRIAHFKGPDYSIQTDQRAEGVRRAFSESRLAFHERSIVRAGSRLEDGYRVGKRHFRGVGPEDRPTAVICFNDLVALGLIRALRELGLGVPADVSVVGHDNIDLLAYLPLGLTTVDIPTREMAETATELLIRHIEASEPLEPTKIVVETRLVARASTGPPRVDP